MIWNPVVCFLVVLAFVCEVQSAPPTTDGVWGPWTSCSKTCGGGLQTRIKTSDGKLLQRLEATCGIMDCNDPFRDSVWSGCTNDCGWGNRSRVNEFVNDTQTVDCHSQACSAVYGDCRGDIVFILDSSGSIGELNWFVAKQFAIDVMRGLKVGATQSHIGAMIYSPDVKVIFNLTDFVTVPELEENLWSMPYISGTTNTADALEALTVMIKDHGRLDVQPIAILLTDGISNIESELAVPMAQYAKDKNIALFVVAVAMADLVEVRRMASDPDETFVFNVTDFGALQAITDYIVNNTCQITRLRQCSPCTGPPCPEECGYTGTRKRTKQCWSIDSYSNQVIPGSEDDVTCPDEICNTPCTQQTLNLPVHIGVDCNRCNFTKGQIWQPDFMDCHKFYICEPIGDGAYRVHKGDCRRLYWDQELHTCVREIPVGAANCIDNEPLPDFLFTTPTPVEPEVCPLAVYPDNDAMFWTSGDEKSKQSCPAGTIFNETVCSCVHDGSEFPSCANDPLLYFPYDDHFDDVTCRRAVAIKYGDGEVDLVTEGDRTFACFSGAAYFEVPFLRTWFAYERIEHFSVAVLFKRTEPTVDLSGIVHNGDCLDRPGFQISLANSSVYGGITVEPQVEWFLNSTVVDVDDWNLAVWVYNGRNLSFYVNGLLVQEKLVTGHMSNTDAPMTIGRLCENCFFTGCIDDLRVYDRALTSADIGSM